MKKVIIADNAGFCFGVKRAMNMAWEELISNKDKKVYALGPLIHNKQAVSKYEEKGLITVDSMEQIEDGNLEMVIRSHGVAKKIYDEAEIRKIDIIDTTCPFVKKIHQIVNKNYKEGKQVLVLGDKDHPEIIGINGWCMDKAIIAKTLEDAKKIDFNRKQKYMVVAQTTMNEKEFEKIIDYINSIDLNIEIENTICSATRVRQQSARDLSEKVDVMVVIGGKHSSNTQKLVKICEEVVDTLAIETSEELKNVDFNSYEIIGVTAGASTPDWIIQDTISYLENL